MAIPRRLDGSWDTRGVVASSRVFGKPGRMESLELVCSRMVSEGGRACPLTVSGRQR